MRIVAGIIGCGLIGKKRYKYLKDKSTQPVSKKAESSEQIQNFKEKVIKLTAADLKTFKQIQKGLKDLLNLIDELK